MKITDYALVFVGITLPFILIAYINIALTIRTFQQEMYYQKVIDAAVEDTMNQMKFVESQEILNNYGYSGEEDNKLSNNPQIAVDTFFNSIYGSLDILDDEAAQSIIQVYVPVIAIMDYNGVYISSIEETEEGEKHVLKPKRYFAFEYAVDNNGDMYIAKNDGWHLLKYDEEKKEFQMTERGIQKRDAEFYILHNIEFTTDDRIFDTCFDKINKTTKTYNYYMTDLYYNPDSTEFTATRDVGENVVQLESEVDSEKLSPLFYNPKKNIEKEQAERFISYLKKYKKELMTEIIIEELSYAANRNNEYARKKGISYNFSFSLDNNDTMYNDIENMGVLALVQGVKVGNRYLNYKAYNYSDLEVTHKYYLSNGEKNTSSQLFGKNVYLYHKTDDCIEYVNSIKNLSQLYTYTKEAAALLGYSPCPICNP